MKLRSGSLIISLMMGLGHCSAMAAADHSTGKQGSIFSRTCDSLLNKTYSSLGISDDNLQKMGSKIQNLSSSQPETDQIHAPFGSGLDGHNVGQSVRKRLNDSDVNWKAMNEIEQTLEAGKDLGFKQRTDLAAMMKTAIHAHETDQKENRSQAMDNLLLRRLNELSKKLKTPDSKKKDQEKKDQNNPPPPQQPNQKNEDKKQDQKPQDSKPKESKSSDSNGGGSSSQSQSKPEPKGSETKGGQASQNQDQHDNSGHKPPQNHTDKQEKQPSKEQHTQKPNQPAQPQNQTGQQPQPKPEPAKQEADGQPAQPKDQKGQQGSHEPTQQKKSNPGTKESVDSKGQEKEGHDQESGSGKGEGNKIPPPDYTTKKGLSDAILRSLYLWELRKYHSVNQFKSGMTNFFNYLANIMGTFHNDVLLRYQSLSKHQIEAVSDEVQYEDLTDFSRQLAKALSDGDTELTYKYAISMQAKLLEIEKYDKLSATEAKLLIEIKALTNLLTSKVDRTAVAVTRKFYGGLPGNFSRADMHQRFGDGLLTPGTKANENFFAAIQKGQLWSFRYMGLLLPYLNVKDKELYTVSPTYSLNGAPQPRAEGQRVIRTTDDLTEIDNFVDELTSKEERLMNLANGDERYYVRRSEMPEPELSRKAIKKVSLLISDASHSMDEGHRTLARNLLQGAYVDYHMSELKTDLDVLEQTGKNIASHTIYHFTFTDHPGPVSIIRTRTEGAEFVKAKAHNPKQNDGGGTNINSALMHALNLILQSKLSAKGDLQWASIVLITDGDDGHINHKALEALRDQIGRDTEIHISVIITAGSNHELKALTSSYFSASFTPDHPPEYSYKELGADLLYRLLRESQSMPPVSDLEKNAPISRTDYANGTLGYDIRRRMKSVTEAATLLGTDPSRQLEVNKMAEKVTKMFKPQRTARPDNSETSIRKTAEILKVVETAVDALLATPMPQNVRRVFLYNLIQDLCRERNLNPIFFDESAAEDQFYKIRLHVSKWLETQKESL